MLLAVAAVVVGSLCLMHYIVLYTEGEVMQGLFAAVIGLVAACVLLGSHRRETAIWGVTLLGGSFLLWQAYRIRKWAVIHEEIVAIVRFAEETKSKTGKYPTNLEGYTFQNPQVRAHIAGLYFNEATGVQLTYFMDDTGISYWYSSKTGFGYYPD